MTDIETARPPGKVQAIGIMHLVSGILNVLLGLLWALYGVISGILTFGIGLIVCCPAFILVPIGIIEIISGARHLSKDHSTLTAPKVTGIIEIASILGCSMLSTIAGILTLVFLSDPEVDEYYQHQQLPKY